MAEDLDPMPAAAGKKKGKMLTIIVVLLLMGGEGIGVFFLAQTMMPAPQDAIGATGGGNAEIELPGENALAEIELADCRPTNMQRGKLITYRIRVSALVAEADHEQAVKVVESKRARIEERVNVVVRSADPLELNQPELETIRRRLKAELEQVFGEELIIHSVVIPEITQSGPGV